MRSTVLIITNDHDVHADEVIRELERREVPVFRFHPEDLPGECRISLTIDDGRLDGEIENEHHRVRLVDIAAAWFRRSQNVYTRPLNLTSEKLEEYVRAQTQATLNALYEGLDAFWVGHPPALRRAEVKARQLVEASRAGLRTPRTLISNDPRLAQAFVASLGATACAVKPLITIGVTDERGYRLPFTTIVPPGHPLASVAAAPTILQPYVEKASELRVVVIGDKVFAAKIDSQASEQTRVDWRAGPRHHETFVLPDEIHAAIRRLMASFELNFASIDMILTPDDEFVFLELNPNGQWLWLERELGLPLVASMADLLTSNAGRIREPQDAREAAPLAMPSRGS